MLVTIPSRAMLVTIPSRATLVTIPSRATLVIRNIGPAQELALARAGIHTATELREIGADRAYARMLRTGSRPHFIGYYVLVMALQGRPWNDCKGAEKDTLRENFDTLVARTLSQGQEPAGIERFLNEIGTGQRR
jgi:DNA transformation protein